MLNKILANKKRVTITIAFILALLVGIVIFVTSNFKEAGRNDSDTKTEQGKEDANIKDDNEQAETNDKEDNKKGENSVLEVLKPDEVAPEDSSDASGSWDETKENDGAETEKSEDILDDDVSWGNIY